MVRKFKGFENTIGSASSITDKDVVGAPRTPGMKYTHYTPDSRVILVLPCEDMYSQVLKIIEEEKGRKIGVLRATDAYDYASIVDHEIFLGCEKEEIGKHIFSGLRDLEAKSVDVIIVEGVDELDQGAAIMNRLGKAASKIVSE
jgi:L-threonylcarbamoyladenylate synthase